MKEILAIIAVVFFFFVLGFVMTFVVETSNFDIATLTIGENTFIVDLAKTPKEQAQGLSGRKSMANDRGMLFEFNRNSMHGFWMRGMEFPLDLVWIRGDVVMSVEKNAPPDNSENPKIYKAPEPVDRVLEINAGLADKLGIKAGDIVLLK